MHAKEDTMAFQRHPDTGSPGIWQRFLRSRPKFVEPVFLLYNLAFRCSIPVHEQFVNSVVADQYSTGADPDSVNGIEDVVNMSRGSIARQNAIQSEASMWLLYCNLARTLPAVFITLLVVSYGDVGGRKLGLLSSNIGGACRFLVYVLLIYCDLSLWWLVLANCLEGLGGTHSTISATAFSYLADVVPVEKKTRRFAIIHGLIFVAAGLGNLATGYILSAVGYLAMFWGLSITYLINIACIILLIPESKDTTEQKTFSIKKVSQEVVNTFRVYTKPRPSQSKGRIQLWLLLLTTCILSFILLGRIDSDTLFMLGYPFYFTPIWVGYYMALQSFCIVVADVIGVPLLLRLGVSDTGIGIVSGISGVSSGILQAFSVSTLMLFFVPLAGLFAATAAPVIFCLMSNIVDPSEQGALMGGIHSLLTVSELVSTTTLDAVYGATVSLFRGTVFLVIAGIYVIIVILFLCIQCIRKKNEYTVIK